MPYEISLGVTYGKSSDDRLDTNVLGSGLPISTLNRREENISTNFDRYVQGKLTVLPSVDLHAGVRRTKVRLEVKDDFTSGTGSNGNNSGSVSYEKQLRYLAPHGK